MTLWHAVVLAVVQGLTEFLPVSSSAHLWFFPWALGWPDGGIPVRRRAARGHAGRRGLVFPGHLGGVACSTGSGSAIQRPRAKSSFSANRRLFWLLVVGTIPGAIVGYFFEHFIEETWRNPGPIAAAMIGVAVLMIVVEAAGELRRELKEVTLGDSLIVGAAQALALFPGVSRSGITIVAGLWRKMTREAAARFSFLLSTPLIAGAAAVEIPKLLKMRHAGTDGHFDVDPGDQHRRVGRGGLRRDRLFPALSANTHAEDLCCLPLRLWYIHPAVDVPPQGSRAIAPARPVGFVLSFPSPGRIVCAY